MNEGELKGVQGYKGILEHQGEEFGVPAQFRDFSRYPSAVTQPDRLTGIATETDGMRSLLIRNLTRCVRDRKRWAMMYVDGDQLKVANDRYGRDLGDKFIIWSTSHVTRSLETHLPSYLQEKAMVVRPKDGSDEVMVWFFDVSDEDLQKIEVAKYFAGNYERKLRGPALTLSASASLIMSGDENVKKEENVAYDGLIRQQETKQQDPLLGKLYEHIYAKADQKVKEMKLNKELRELAGFTQQQLKELNIGMDTFIDAVRQHYGGKRNSGELIKIVQRINAAYFIKSLQNRLPAIFYRLFLRHLGLTDEEVQNANTVNALLKIYHKVYPENTERSRISALQERLQAFTDNR